MTIGIDASRANRVEKTGIEWYAYHLLNAMKRITNHESPHQSLRVGTGQARIMNADFFLYTDTALTDDLANLPTHWHEKLLGWWPRKFWTQGRLSLEMLLRAPDLLFIPSHVIPMVHPKRVVLTCHDIGFERRPELYPTAELLYHRWTMRYGVRAATHIIAVSEFTKRELMDVYGLPSEKITVVHHGWYGGANASTLGVSSTPSVRSPYFLYVGRIEAKKNLHVIIDAFAELKRAKKISDDMQLLLVGRRGYQSEAILQSAQEKGGGAIRYLPWVPSETLCELYRNARAFLFPSLYEGFGLPLLESLSYGLPVIASDIPALREVGERHAYFVSPTASAFAEAMESISAQSSTTEEREKSKAYSAQFSWEKSAKKTLTVLHNAL